MIEDVDIYYVPTSNTTNEFVVKSPKIMSTLSIESSFDDDSSSISSFNDLLSDDSSLFNDSSDDSSLFNDSSDDANSSDENNIEITNISDEVFNLITKRG